MTAVPALRDQHGQSWPWPPLAPEAPGPDDGPAPARCWLFFLPGAFTPVCTAELGWVDELASRLAPAGVGLCVVAPDSAAVLRAFGEGLGVRTPLLSDFWPHGAAARAVGEFNEATGRPHRTSVLVDARGAVLARVRAGAAGQRRMEDHLEATAAAGGDAVGWAGPDAPDAGL
ncbi:redoxin domain-containing protein [Citricoccus sp. SGAir0253]|uniref:redoxin domain-containing protein n=1 Tax=Citricoccus sp. SGAir0253 TaxID=2567881 RepID=UPI0010CCF8F2|nr:redoxin domain-containing protein [Citricoccus sp. SGAir0253]QCU78323.1 redoxin domain-containing protein [Citricoccus sp. SGAir0253]